ncbi:MAG: hypothetical protein WC069_04535 [Candidatus Shapirobacteria bacterium]
MITLDFAGYNSRLDKAVLKNSGEIKILSNGARVIYFNKKGKDRMVMMSGVHSDERGGPIAILKFLENNQITIEEELVIVPLLNDHGWDVNKREHSGIDINRNFNKNGPEFIVELMEILEEKPIDVFVDLHEDCDENGFVYKLKNDPSKLADNVAKIANCPIEYEEDHEIWGDTTEKFVRSLGCIHTVTTEAPGKISAKEKVEWNYKIVKYLLTN